MIEYLMNPQSVEALGWTLLHSLWQGAVFAILLALLFIALRSYSAQSRYIVATGLLTAFFLTVGTTFWYQWQSAFERSELAQMQTIVKQADDILIFETNNTSTTKKDLTAANSQLDNNLVVTTEQSSWFTLFSNYYERHLPLLVTIWLLGVLFLQLRFLGQLAYVQRLKHYGTQLIPKSWNDKIEDLEGKLRIQKKVQYLTSMRIESPMVIGWLKPVVLLPRQLLHSLSKTEIYAVLAHELAHIRREDFIVNLMQTLLCNVFFFHPGVWWMSNRVDEEREHCCDDLAVAVTGQATSYAKTLINVSELQLSMHQNVPLAMALSGSSKQRDRGGFAGRIRRLFMVSNGVGTFREGFATACILFAALLVGIAATGHTVQAKDIQDLSISGEPNNEKTHIGETIIPLELSSKKRTKYDTLKEVNRLGIEGERISTRIEQPEAPERPEDAVGQTGTRIDALLMACAEGDLDFVMTLIESGIDVNGVGSEGFTPLMIATSENEPDIVTYLLSNGANINKVSNGWTALLEAADEGSLESMKRLLEAGAKVNYYSALGSPTAITMAASEGHLDCLKLLLKNGAEIDGIRESVPPLHIAAAEDQREIIEYLISQQVNINKKDPAGRTALMYAASEGHKYSVQILIESNADRSIIDSEGATARDYAEYEKKYDIQNYLKVDNRPNIHQATIDGLMEKVKRMVEEGMDINTRDDYGRTPLHLAAANNHTIDMRVLIDLGAMINAQDKRNRTPLMYAAADGKRGAAVLLVSKLADVNIQDVDGMTALDWSRNGGNADLVNFLALITENKIQTDRNGRSRMSDNDARKMEEEKRSINNELRQKEAKERLKDSEKRREEFEKREKKAIQKDREFREKMQKELEKRSEKTIEKDIQVQVEKNIEKRESVHLSKNGLHIRQIDIKEEATELMDAARNGSIEECRRLLNNGAYINTADDTGQTALMVAAMSNRIENVKFLIENGADVNMSSSSGLTALHYAALENHDQIAILLLKNKAKVDATMRYSSTDGNTTNELIAWEYIGATPLLIAVEASNVEIAQALIKAGANPDYRLTKIEYRLKKGNRPYLQLREVIGIDELFKEQAEIKSSDDDWTPKKQAQQMNKSKILNLFP